jgi:hypothetical protein
MDDKTIMIGAVFGLVIIYWAVTSVRDEIAKARLDAQRKLMDTIIRNVSHRYERPGEELQAEVTKAVDELHDRVEATQDIRRKPETYRVYAASLVDAMAQACVDRGFYSGQHSTEPRDGEYRVDMLLDKWQALRWCAHIGFQHCMPNYTPLAPEWQHFRREDQAKIAEDAIEKLEYSINHRANDPEYSDSLARNMLVWEQWPQEQRA